MILFLLVVGMFLSTIATVVAFEKRWIILTVISSDLSLSMTQTVISLVRQMLGWA